MFRDHSGQVFIRGGNLAEPDEGPYNGDVDFNRPLATKDRRQHSYAVLGEGIGRIAQPFLAPGLEVTICDLQLSSSSLEN